jgi:type IV pilus assembly protein PilM
LALLSPVVDAFRRLEIERRLNLRPAYPPVALEIDQREAVLVRVKARRKALPLLEAYKVLPLPETEAGASIARAGAGSHAGLQATLRSLYEATGTRPGRISLILPDNLAKISIVTLPERPASRKQLLEVLRFKLRRSVPFRMEDATLAYQVLPQSEGSAGTDVLVAVMLRSVLEQHEQPLLAAGARPGLVELATSSIFNLLRERMEKSANGGSDVALLNCVGSYFTLVIARRGRPIFFRCKSFTREAEEAAGNGMIARELASSLSYYEDKLQGKGIAATYVRSTTRPAEEIGNILKKVGIERTETIHARSFVEPRPGLELPSEVAERLAPALGAAAGKA